MLFKQQNLRNETHCDFATSEDGPLKNSVLHRYDFAIIDYDLNSTNALKIATKLDAEFDLPVIIISSSLNNLFQCQMSSHKNIRGVVSKWEDPRHIVEKAMEYVAGHEPLAPGIAN